VSLWDKNGSKDLTSSSAEFKLLFFPPFFRHLDFFEMVRNEDEKELARKFEKVSFYEYRIML
jgi:hypothetical protein